MLKIKVSSKSSIFLNILKIVGQVIIENLSIIKIVIHDGQR